MAANTAATGWEAVTAYATAIMAIFTVVMAAATMYLAWIAREQLPILAKQAKSEFERRAIEATRRKEAETLQACTRFDIDPILYHACRRLWDSADCGRNYKENPKISIHDVIVVANYLDGIAIGAEQGFYDPVIVRDHLGPHISKFIEIILPNVFGNTNDYEAMARLCASWRSGDIRYRSKHA